MVDFLILYRDFGVETGVTVSVKHLIALMEKEKFSYLACGYKDDMDLLHITEQNDSRVLILQAPTFMSVTLEKIIDSGRYVNLVIHSTISYLQVEEEAFANVQRYMNVKKDNFSISNPCIYEVDGFKSYAACEIFYLPNTFNKILSAGENVVFSRLEKAKRKDVVRIGLFCAYRPFKNIMTQITACNLLRKNLKLDVELHLFKSNECNPVYKNVLKLLQNMRMAYVLHENCRNDELYDILQEIDIGLQVSYSETFSYIICEHMMMGTPTVASTAVPFASKVAEFNNANSIADCIREICVDDRAYARNVSEAVERVARVKEENNHDALITLRKMLERSKGVND